MTSPHLPCNPLPICPPEFRLPEFCFPRNYFQQKSGRIVSTKDKKHNSVFRRNNSPSKFEIIARISDAVTSWVLSYQYSAIFSGTRGPSYHPKETKSIFTEMAMTLCIKSLIGYWTKTVNMIDWIKGSMGHIYCYTYNSTLFYTKCTQHKRRLISFYNIYYLWYRRLKTSIQGEGGNL